MHRASRQNRRATGKNAMLRYREFAVAALGVSALTLSVEPVAAADPAPKTPIRHIVVIYDENISFDHYFATYPNAANLPGETPFHAAPGTPTINGLTGALIARNPNSTRPFRLGPGQPVTCDMDHAYSAEQKAYHRGLLDRFVEATTEYAEEQKNCGADGWRRSTRPSARDNRRQRDLRRRTAVRRLLHEAVDDDFQHPHHR